MFADKLKKLANPEENKEDNNKKKIENLVFLVIILIITIVVINVIWNGKDNSAQKEEGTSTKQLAGTINKINKSSDLEKVADVEVNESLEEKLEQILSKIQGVGEVQVLINYSESSEIIAMYNETSKVSTTEETDTSGGIRKIEETDTQKDIIYQEEDGQKTPITQKVVEPKIEGAIITAKGAGDMTIKTNIIQAVEAVTGLATHKIQVFVMN